jgi:hypothetical protein
MMKREVQATQGIEEHQTSGGYVLKNSVMPGQTRRYQDPRPSER